MTKPNGPREQLKDLVIKQKKTQLPIAPLNAELNDLHERIRSLDGQLSEIVIQVIVQDSPEDGSEAPAIPPSIYQEMDGIDQWFGRTSKDQYSQISFYQTYYNQLVNTVRLLEEIHAEE
jgi:hypothetical protein